MAQAERLREGYRYSVPSGMAVVTRSYCPVHPFIVVIEVRTVQDDTRCCVRNKCLLQLTGVRCLTWEGGKQHSCCDREMSTHPALHEMGFGPGRGSE